MNEPAVPSKPPYGGRLTQKQAALVMNCTVRGIQRAARIQRQAPDLAAKIMAGAMSTGEAERLIKERLKIGRRPLDQALIDVVNAFNRYRHMAEKHDSGLINNPNFEHLWETHQWLLEMKAIMTGRHKAEVVSDA